MTPNESEAATLTGCSVETLEDAERAADLLIARGVRNVIVTLGTRGALVKTASMTQHVAAFNGRLGLWRRLGPETPSLWGLTVMINKGGGKKKIYIYIYIYIYI